MKKYGLFAAILALGVCFISGGKAEAAKVFSGESHSPTTYRALCTAGTPVDFAAYASNVSLNTTTGRITYTINVQWRKCNGTPTRAYAVYDGPQVCPLAGYYGAGPGGAANDCVKYIGNPPYNEPGSGLTCPAGTNSQCVTSSFTGARRQANEPSSTTESIAIPMSTVIPGWGSAPGTGQHTLSNSMCQFYKTGSSFTVLNENRCMTLSITVRWTDVLPLTISCGGATPTVVEAGQPFTLDVGFTTAGGSGSGTATYTIRVNGFTEAGVPEGSLANVFAPIARNGGTGTGTIPNSLVPGTPVLNSPGVYDGVFRVEVTDSTNSPLDCPFTIRAVERPYHKVYGGDVSAGAAFGSPCYDTDARIIGYNSLNFAFFGLSVGSGTQLASFALNAISEFGSGQIRNSADPATFSEKNLTFANTTAGYGGSLDPANMSCAPDYWAGATGVLSGNQTIAGRNLANGAKQTIYVDGDAYISGNITYTGDPLSGNYNNIGSIPAFRLIVRGNIYIAPNVTELNGLYVAVPTDATDGRVYTCGINASGTFRQPNLGEMNGACRTNLTVYGAVVADLIKFTRSAGSLRQAVRGETFDSGGNPAEKFIYAPEVWLTSDFNGDQGLSSIQTLPPIL